MRYADSHCSYDESYENGHHIYTYRGECVVTGKEVSVTVPAGGLFAYRQGAYIQDAFPTLSASEREFLMTGISEEGWKQMFKEAE